MFNSLHPVSRDKIKTMGKKFANPRTLHKYGNSTIRISAKWKRYILVKVENTTSSAIRSYLLQDKYGNVGLLASLHCLCYFQVPILESQTTEHLLQYPLLHELCSQKDLAYYNSTVPNLVRLSKHKI